MEELASARLEAALRHAYRQLQRGGSGDCPGVEVLAALAIGEPVEQKERLADHVVSCRRCAEDYQILMRTHTEVGAPASKRVARLMWISAAAVVVIAVGAALLLRTSRPEEALRGGRVRQDAALVAPTDGATLAAAPEKLRWPPQPGAEGYSPKLYDASGETIWESGRVATPSVDLPPSAASRLQSGQSYFWTVEVEMPIEKQRLGPYSFRMRR